MKKILFFIESLAGGGAEKVLTTLVKNINKLEFDITVLSVVNTGIYVDEIKQYCHYQYMLDDSANLNLLQRIKYRIDYKFIYNQPPEAVYRRYIKEEYDIEVAFIEGFATKFIAASPNPHSKKIAWVHIDMEKNPYADTFFSSIAEESATYEKYNQIISVSQSVKTAFERKFSISNRTTVIYNPIDQAEIIEKASSLVVPKPTELCIVCIGRLEWQKGYDRLISALSALRNTSCNYTLWILGEGSERHRIEQLISSNNLEDQVKLLGFKRNPYPWLNAADVLLCTSRAEGYSLVIAEAFTLGKPVISVDCAGPNELLNFGEYGKLIENTDHAIYNAMSDLLCHKMDLYRYKQLALARRPFFELTNIISQIEKVFSNDDEF